MSILIMIAVCLFLLLSILIRTVVLHPLLSVFYAVKDIINYFRYHQWNNMRTGELIAYTALFGKGKTLSVVHYIVSQYLRYNNKRIFDIQQRKWLMQKVVVLSNVALKIPYVNFVSLQQIVSLSDKYREDDRKNCTLTCILVLGDEFSVQMNSRNFKSNINGLFLNTLLTCRHNHISLIYDAQRFQHVNALLRQVTSYVVSCNKVWRVMVLSKYDAWDLENCTNISSVKPLSRFGWFIRNRDFDAYDTLAIVGNLEHSCSSGDMLSDAEILQNIAPTPDNIIAVKHPRRSLKKMINK